MRVKGFDLIRGRNQEKNSHGDHWDHGRNQEMNSHGGHSDHGEEVRGRVLAEDTGITERKSGEELSRRTLGSRRGNRGKSSHGDHGGSQKKYSHGGHWDHGEEIRGRVLTEVTGITEGKSGDELSRRSLGSRREIRRSVASWLNAYTGR